MIDGGAHAWTESQALGRYFYSLLTDCSWAVRHVETIKILDLTRWERRNSLDIRPEQLRARADRFGFDCDGQLPVPLGLMSKGLMIDFSVTDQTGSALSLWASEVDSRAAQAALLACLESCNGLAGLSPPLQDKIYQIARSMPSADDVNVISGNALGQVSVTEWALEPGIAISQREVDTWESLFEIETFSEWICRFTVNYMPIVQIPKDAASAILKYQFVDTVRTDRRRSIKEAVGLESAIVVADIPHIGFAQRNHIRVVAPSGVDISGPPVFVSGTSGDKISAPSPLPPRATVFSRVTPERLIVYTKEFTAPTARRMLGVLMRPNMKGFSRPALSSLFVSIVALIALIFGKFGTLSLVDGDSPEAMLQQLIVTFLLLCSTVFSAYLVRHDEHESRARMLVWPRSTVAVSVVLTAISGFCMLFPNIPSTTLGWICGCALGVAIAAFGMLLTASIAGRVNREEVLDSSNSTIRVIVDNY